MAAGKGVWSIDIGHAAIKALRCTVHDDGFWLVADAFDYIEYPKLLTLPDANPEQMIRDALKEFLSRNELKNDKVAISVPGQAGLARFFKAPPVEAKRIPDIVKYEAKQQIPFPLDEVVWDFQAMPGAHVDEGISLETEIGIFAMKRDQVFRSLQPFLDAGIDVDYVQLSPVALYNFVSHDLLTANPTKEEYDPANQPESYVILSMGTETTDLVITNGFRVWQRSLPIGGNHFTKQLTKDLKLTFAKAEHLKRHAREADDAKLIFQSMRPKFNELVTDIQRSIGFFQTLDRKAKISRIVPVGNAMKLPGLVSYLAKNLGYEAVEIDGFQKLSGSEVTSSAAFRDNIMSFAACYGMCLQGLRKSCLQTNLLPQEILVDRLIREKKPWAVAAVAALLLACTVNFFFHWKAWYTADPEKFASAISAVEQVERKSNGHKSADDQFMTDAENLRTIGNYVVGNEENRRLWPELLRAVTASLPVFEGKPEDIWKTPIEERPFLYIDSVESKYYPDVSFWYSEGVRERYRQTVENSKRLEVAAEEGLTPEDLDEQGAAPMGEEGQPAASGAAAPANAAMPEANAEISEAEGEEAMAEVDENGEVVDELAGPTESGWVIQLKGKHYHNSTNARQNSGPQYVRNTLIHQLDTGTIMLDDGSGQMVEITMKELGISHPVIVLDSVPKPVMLDNPDYDPATMSQNGDLMATGMPPGGPMGPMGSTVEIVPAKIPAKVYEFTVQFCWQETPMSKRIENRKIQAEAEAEAAAAALAEEGY
ncbi:fimbrial assembly protein PilM [Blastopirellula marina]|uniref:Probable fimbrial assembly protein PilM n=1 Tax=Blastopirellula marina DSM 3645 TaxID=314230 RepID=A3ZL52_9BACT|nr:fimbrial assembly protein PilM [Blastopirellula marina]EAQ82485.1 probable fimbrial assembly protein PilM [Blastopirellula marina DSM 3645]